MTTPSSHDTEALDRLRSRQADDDRWRTDVLGGRCRRTTLAARLLELEAATRSTVNGRPMRDHAPRATGVPEVVRHGARSAKWSRVARRLQLSPAASCLAVGVLRVGGAALLTQTNHLFARAGALRTTTLEAFGELLSANGPPREPFKRARRLIRRLSAWEREAMRSVESSIRESHPDSLFEDAVRGEPRLPTTPSSASEPLVGVTLAAVLERRP